MLDTKKDVKLVWNVEALNADSMKDNYRFFYHWVRATDKWSVHFKNKCIHASHLKCNVPCSSKMNKQQPLRVMRGWANSVEVKNDTIIIS